MKLSERRNTEKEIFFKVSCPGLYNHIPHKLMMFRNGSVSNNIRYQDICTDRFLVNVAYNNVPGMFELRNNLMAEYPINNIKGQFSNMPSDYEILLKFFQNHPINVNWIYCYQNWGWYDYQIGKWTGAVGQVILSR